jgi:hypothetical protein
MPQSSQILEALRESILRVQEISKTELCTIHVKTRNERLFTTSRLSNHSKAEFIADHDDGRIFAASSMFKIFITTATLLIVEKLSASPEPNNIYRGLRGAWDRPFTDVFNQHSKDFKLNPLYGDPSLLQTSLHFNGPRNINHLLLAPDGSPLLSENEFLRNISQYSEDGHQGDINSAGWLISSDADYVLLALLIEVVSQTPLSTFLKEHIFMPLGMRCTYTSTEELSLVPIQKRPQPHMVSSNGHRKTLAFDTIHSLADTVELATTGGCMSAADIGIFFTAILEGLYGKPGDKLFGKDFCTSLLRGRTSLVRQGSGYTHLGLYTALDSDVPGSRSLNRMISPESYFSTYVLGKGHSDQRFNAYYLADPATGWASTAYFLPTIETFVIVLTNTSGPLDASDLISRLFLQEILELRPLQNGFQKVLPPLENRASSTLAEKNRAHYVALAAQMWGENALVYKKLEQDDAAPDTLSTDCPNICGRFDHEISSQSLVIDSVSGPNQKQVLRITIKTETKSSRPMRLVRKGKMFRICSLRRTGFPSLAVDCFGDWRNLEFEAEEENGVIMCLSRQGPRLKDRFIQNSRVDSDSDVGSNISCGVESLSWPDVSVASSRTSTLGNMNLEADEFIAILLRDEELKSLFTSAIQGDQVGAEKFERNFQRILEQYALDLKKEATNKQQEAAISFIRSRARYISSGVRRKFDPQNDDKENFTKLKAQLNQKGIGVDTFLEGLEPSGSGSWPPLDSPVRVGGQENENENRKMVESGAENSSSDDGATEGNHFEEPFQISLVREFMTSSQAFRLFYENFRQFVHPTFKSKLVRLIERLSGPEYADSISSSSISKLKTLVPEIEDINPSQIDVSYEEELGLLNRLKGAIEDLSGENWDWWPLKPRMRPLSPGSARLHWRCVRIWELMTGLYTTDSFSRVAKKAGRKFLRYLQESFNTSQSKPSPHQLHITLRVCKYQAL